MPYLVLFYLLWPVPLSLPAFPFSLESLPLLYLIYTAVKSVNPALLFPRTINYPGGPRELKPCVSH